MKKGHPVGYFFRTALLTMGITFGLGVLTSCQKEENEFWIYTSIYKDTIAEIEGPLKEKFPDLKIQWFQGGSETVAGKVNAELAAGGTKADLFLTSDPFWYLEMKHAGHLLPYQSPAAQTLPEEMKDPENMFVVNRLPLMVIGYNSEAISENQVPKTWKELQSPQWKEKLSMGNPLQSGTNFTTVAFLSQTYGWDFFKKLRNQKIISSGGNSSVINRMETRERPVGVVLLENILKAQSNGSPVRAIYPSDGPVAIMSPIAISKQTKHTQKAKEIYDWFFSEVAQNAIVKSGMYSPLPNIQAPQGALPWAQIKEKILKWSPQLADEILKKRDEIKKNFSQIILQ